MFGVWCSTPFEYTRSKVSSSNGSDLGVVMDEPAGQSTQAEVLLRELQMPGRQIDVGDDRAVLRELREIGAHAAADFEHLLAARASRTPSRLGIHGAYTSYRCRSTSWNHSSVCGCADRAVSEPTGLLFHWFWTWPL